MKHLPSSIHRWLRITSLTLAILIALAGCQSLAATPALTLTLLPTSAPPTETHTPSTTPSPTVPPTHTATPAPTMTPTLSAEAICPTTDEGTIEPQCQALVDFYQAAGGENLFNVTGWLSDQPICTWQGITCADGQVVGLDLTCGNISSLPPEIGQLTNLRELDLGGVGGACNNWLDRLPQEIGQLSNLRELDLSYNHFSELPPVIGQLTNLRALNMSSNTGMVDIPLKIPPEIGQLSNLETLDLSTNWIEELPPEIVQLTSLQELHLENNPLTTLPPKVCQIPGLRVSPPELCNK